MLFNSFIFLCFFPIVVLGFWIAPKKFRYIWLLLASSYFIFYESGYAAAVTMLITILSYCIGLWLDKKRKKGKNGKLLLTGGIILCLIPLALLKYSLFLLDIFGYDIERTGIYRLSLPIGISFYTLQAIAYLTDIYRGGLGCEKNLLKYALFLSFFPKFISGPLTNSKTFLQQIGSLSNVRFKEKEIKSGLIFIMWGYFQKVVLADNLAVLVTRIYDYWEAYSGTVILTGTIIFAIQLYADFAGYTYIAKGTSLIVGIKLEDNFKQPYLATGIKDFWRRWHISLSLWLREYIYIPLGGNRKGTVRKYLNLMITFLISGLWHGASWGFLAWGSLHGIYQILEDLLKKVFPKENGISGELQKKCLNTVRHLAVFMLVVIAWLFFRASGLKTALRMLIKCMTDINLKNLFDGTFLLMGLSGFELMAVFIAMLLLLVIDILHERQKSITVWLDSRSRILRWGCYLGMLFILFIAAVRQFGGEASGFIYAQF